jgi:quinolinate synthase
MEKKEDSGSAQAPCYLFIAGISNKKYLSLVFKLSEPNDSVFRCFLETINQQSSLMSTEFALAEKNLTQKGFLDMEVDPTLDLFEEIERLKKEKNAIILAHYYQESDIQDIADYIGDSLGLSQKAANTDADIIVFAGVHFMAETAKMLSPQKKVLLPDLKAGCSLADSCPPHLFRKYKEKYPDHVVVSYINCTAELKTLTDICCTSTNAVQIIESIPEDQPVIFAPDINLGKYLKKKPAGRI